MKLNSTQLEMLRSISERPRQRKHFYESGRTVEAAKRALDPMEREGLIFMNDISYEITEAGQDVLDRMNPVPPRTFGNASMTTVYKPQSWAPVRPNADQHLNYASRGF